MSISNPLQSSPIYQNDPDGLIIPYKLISRTDREVMTNKYQRLRKATNGLIIRLGIPERGV